MDHVWGLPSGSVVKNLTALQNAGGMGSVPGSGISPGGGNGNLLQNYCLEYSIDRGMDKEDVVHIYNGILLSP